MVKSSDILNANVLIVDDQKSNVSLLVRMLDGAGYTSIASTMNPHEVCELHRKHRYDLILLDLKMPGMDGFEVMEGLKAIEPEGYLPVLVITALPALNLRALQAGAKDFISKPFDLAEVLLRVHNMLEVRLLHEAARNNGKVLESLALHDPLTGLANRRLLTDRMSMAPSPCAKEQRRHGGGVSGSGRIQADQRHVGPRRRGRSAENGRKAPGGSGARRGYGGAPGR